MYISKTQSAPFTRAHVLVVARDADTCLLLSGLLAREGFYSALVSDVAEMDRILREETPPHAVLLDDTSYSPQSIETLIRSMHASPVWSPVPLLVLSARDGEDQETAFLDMGADDCVAKPLKTKALIARIKRRIQHA